MAPPMGMERVRRAGSVMPIFFYIPRQRRCSRVPPRVPLDDFVVEIASMAARPRVFKGLFVRNATFTPVEDSYIQRSEGTAFGRKAQLKVDGSPESVELMKFDVSVLNGDNNNEPDQILSAVLSPYSMTESDFGGVVSIVPGGDMDGDAPTWYHTTTMV